MKKNPRALILLSVLTVLTAVGPVRAQEPDEVTAADLAGATPKFDLPASVKPTGSASARSSVRGIDSLVTFGDSFSVFGFDQFGNPKTSWSYNMIGNPPRRGGTTAFNAPIVPVSLLLLDANGDPRYVKGQLLYSDASQYVSPVLESPIFQDFQYTSSKKPTQFVDAVQRAEFFFEVGHDDQSDNPDRSWHTIFRPHLKTGRLMLLPFGSYKFALHSDGSCCEFVLVDNVTFGNLLFPPTYPFDGSTIIGAAELAGDITTKDVSTFLFPNTFLYTNHNPKDCCILGFHTYDFEPGIPSNGNLPRLYVLNYSSWISPGLFGGGFADITALSHELTEATNDPFVDNVTPWWLAPFGLCDDSLEVGDVIEGLPDATFPIRLNSFTYHPQNEALLPWFEFKSPSTAIDGAYSYPNTTVITALSPVERPGCK